MSCSKECDRVRISICGCALMVPASDLSEGFAAVATLRRAGIPRKRRLLMAAGFTLPILFGATLGFVGLRHAPEIVTLSVLAGTGGALVAVVVEEMSPRRTRAIPQGSGRCSSPPGSRCPAATSVCIGA